MSGSEVLPAEGEVAPTASLAEVLAARDRRASRQRRLLAEQGLPVLSLTLVSPGGVKDSPGRRLLMDAMERSFAEALQAKGLGVRARMRGDGAAGPEALWSVESSPESLKRIALRMEDERPWGRLLDADVVVPGDQGEPLPMGRDAFGLEPRACLVCGGSAKACIGGRRHAPAEVAALASAMVLRLTGRS